MNRRMEFENDEAWHNRGYLPHYDQANKYQMITYRLADSLPKDVLAGFAGGSPANKLSPIPDSSSIDEIKKRKLVEKYLDQGYGACYLEIPEVAQLVVENWFHFDGERYDLIAYVIMPNHVHLLIKTYANYTLKDVIHSWKSFTAHKIIKFLDRNAGEPPASPGNEKVETSIGKSLELPKKIWMEDYWDRFIRDERHFCSVISYIVQNPVKANLVKDSKEWLWTYINHNKN
ncbi:transposase [Lentisphaera profundi]|uniref:Transposase n=1 Tax=Lentisphaera profundi TaxID=1658616 RepID=A0ABY7VNQ3_9BACT|nr:transposase [Lentisphaera profundi]WDE95302.1 transposase [Lentisphaera profundi]